MKNPTRTHCLLAGSASLGAFATLFVSLSYGEMAFGAAPLSWPSLPVIFLLGAVAGALLPLPSASPLVRGAGWAIATLLVWFVPLTHAVVPRTNEPWVLSVVAVVASALGAGLVLRSLPSGDRGPALFGSLGAGALMAGGIGWGVARETGPHGSALVLGGLTLLGIALSGRGARAREGFVIGLLWLYPVVWASQPLPPSPQWTLVRGVTGADRHLVLAEQRQSEAHRAVGTSHTLFVNGVPQFRGDEEPGSRSCVTAVPVEGMRALGKRVRRALVLGAGDGMIVRDLVAYPHVESVVLVDRDEALVALARTEKKIRMYNLDSLRSPKVTVDVSDPWYWIQHARGEFDLIVVALGPPRTATERRYLTGEFYHYLARRLSSEGLIVVPSGSLFADSGPGAGWVSEGVASVRATFRRVGLRSWVYEDSRTHQAVVAATFHPAWDLGAYFRSTHRGPGGRTAHVCRQDANWRFPQAASHSLNAAPGTTPFPSSPLADYSGAARLLLPR